MADLKGLRVAVFATDGVEESEIVEPIKVLRDAGAEVTVISPKSEEVQAVQNDLDKTVKIPVDGRSTKRVQSTLTQPICQGAR